MIKTKSTPDVAPLPVEKASHLSLSSDAMRSDSASEYPNDEATALEQVRELLFGEQVRTMDVRLQEVERRSIDEIARRSQELAERMENLGRDLGTRLDQLVSQMANLEAAMHENNEKISQRTQELRAELTERFNEGTEALGRRLSENHEQAIAHTRHAAEALEKSKIGREALAVLLEEMASRVGGK